MGCLRFFLINCNKNPNTLRSLYSCMVEYNSTIWSPAFSNKSNAIERVQRKFVNYINYKFKTNLHYESCLNNMKLLKLSDRRSVTDILVLYKIINSKFDCPDLLSLINFNIPIRFTRSNNIFYFNSFVR